MMNILSDLAQLTVVFPKCDYCDKPSTYIVTDKLGFCNDCNPFCTGCHNIDCDCTC